MQDREDLTQMLPVLIIALAVLPALVLLPFGYVLFRYVVAPRFGSSWFAWFAAAMVVAAVAVIYFGPGVGGYVNSYVSVVKAALAGDWGGVTWAPLVVSAVFPALAAGAGLARWRIKAQSSKAFKEIPQQQDKDLLADWWANRAVARLAKKPHPADGVLLGVDRDSGREIVLTDQELNQHTFLIGTTGSGKTTTTLNFVESAIQRGLPLVLVDGKGDLSLAARVKALADGRSRPFWHFAMAGASAHYNPLAVGGITELKDKLLYLTDWSEPHYEALAGRYLQLVFKVFELTNTKPYLGRVGMYLDPDRLEMLARNIEDASEQQRIFDTLDEFNNAEIRGLAARIATLTESEIGHLFAETEGGQTMDLHTVIQSNGVAVFSLDSLSFPEYAPLLGRLIVTDIKSVAARAYQHERKRVYTIFDEFSVFASRAVVDLIGKARGAGIHALIATQSLADIEAAAGAEVVEQIIDNCNTFLIQRQNSPASAERLAGVVGTVEGYEITRQVEHLWPGLADVVVPARMGTKKEVREYLVHPDEIKRLRVGEAILVRKLDFDVQRVKIRQVS